MVWLIVFVAVLAAVLLWGEIVHWRARRRRLGSRPGPGGREAVLVLGFKNRSTRPNLVNRFRVRAGLRSLDPEPGSSVLILSGGGVGSEVPEAELMASYARERRGYDGPLLTETASRTTWENIQNTIPLIEDADRIKIVSNSLHAEKGRAYLRKLRPDLADRLVQADEYRFGELIWLKPVLAVVGIENLRRYDSQSER
ncbi:YdcF family protein [Sinomonas albida]|uniref:YdcF family protein n=1 Tax=Sinomonas albida TaxID=369942 RepID=UPI001B3C7782|nr:YdcF family protein [Sinomonas albida]